jgi:hypothetical protein
VLSLRHQSSNKHCINWIIVSSIVMKANYVP